MMPNPFEIISWQVETYLKACTPPLTMAIIAAVLAVIIHPIFLIGTVILLLDSKARYKEFLELVRKNGQYTEKDVRYFSLSWCRRHAAIAAGIPKEKFYERGYRWWHVLPDGAPQCFFKISFWKRVLGIHGR